MKTIAPAAGSERSRESAVLTALLVVGIRPVFWFIGYMAVAMFGYATGERPPVELGSKVLDLFAAWDANWYLTIARSGYRFVPDLQLQQGVVFFPAYPLLMRLAGYVLGRHAWAYVIGGLFLSLMCLFVALLYLFALAREVMDDERAKFALWLIGVYPFAIFFGAVYVESLLLLALVATIFHFERRQFGYAALWGTLAGLTKTSGFLLSIPLAIMALQARGKPTERHIAAAFGAASTPILGMVAYSTFLWWFTGDPLIWLKGHAAWGREYHGLGALVADRFAIIRHAGIEAYSLAMPYDLMNALAALFAIGSAWPVARRFGLAYGVLMLVFILPPLAAGGFISAGRFSSVLFPAFLWIAASLPASSRSAWLASFGAVQGLVAAAFYTWRPLY